MSNAKEIVRITGGKGIIFSSGPCASPEGLRGPQDIINLCVLSAPHSQGSQLTGGSATILGMPANLAKDSVSLTPKMVLLRAREYPSAV